MDEAKLAKARRETFAEIFALINYKGVEAAYRQWPVPLVEFVEPYARGDFRIAKDFLEE